jgi:tRNA(adenine34) deaminase
MDDIFYMQQALALAREAFDEGEVPVGCVIVRGDDIVGRGRNRREGDKNALAHAEIEAINDACRHLGGWRLWDCTLYVTLEPCPMCAGALSQARISRVVFGAYDEAGGCCGSVYRIPEDPAFTWYTPCEGGCLQEECEALWQDAFASQRLGKM